MRYSLHALGIGPGADPAVITQVAREAEQAGFARLWAGEHIVMVDGPDEPYPYAPDGRIAVASDADWLDPFATLTFAAAATKKIRLATGVLLLAEHNPLIVAKQAASLDRLSRGRLDLGIGIGWSRAEFEALGVPFAGRITRMRQYAQALREIWSTTTSSYQGSTVRFAGVRSYPKPQRGRLPLILGGTSDAALDRVAEYGDGWYGFNVSVADLPERIRVLASCCERRGRDMGGLDIAVDVGLDSVPAEKLAALGVSERVLVATPPSDAREARSWVRELRDRHFPPGD
ncbi:MAG: TIGR03619 family F420-dependent LLM class oxidoreductase [Microbacteriaceae bacterium]